ncbi:hypothetical protein KEM56_006370 [Ascosphaera pollenicola]|nr:hypothetical protein KEM56_006370 [Ascosphaera pollenicola]
MSGDIVPRSQVRALRPKQSRDPSRSIPIIMSRCLQHSLMKSMQENRSGIIKIDQFDWRTVDRLLDALYRGDYTAELPEGCQELSAKYGGDCMIDALDKPWTPPAIHARVAMIADYYDITSLKDLANKRLIDYWQENYDGEKFAFFLYEAVESGAIEVLRPALLPVATENITDLLEREEFDRLSLPRSFVMPLLFEFNRRMHQSITQPKDWLQVRNYLQSNQYCGSCRMYRTPNLIIVGTATDLKLQAHCLECDGSIKAFD